MAFSLHIPPSASHLTPPYWRTTRWKFGVGNAKTWQRMCSKRRKMLNFAYSYDLIINCLPVAVLAMSLWSGTTGSSPT